MQQPIPFYKEEINSLNTVLIALKKQLLITRILRLLAFLTISFSAYIAFVKNNLFFIVSIIALTAFVYLVTKHLRLKQTKNLLEAKLTINKTEIAVLNGAFSDLESGKEFTNPAHYFSNDIDLFGVGSFFQYINRTATNEGKKLLAAILTSNDITVFKKNRK